MRGIAVKTKFSEKQIYVLAEASSLSRVVQNLLDNAMKFSKNGGVVKISLESDGRYATLKMHNYGSIINPEERKDIFKRFWQGSKGKHYVAGSGLGLYLCHQLVTAFGGKITYTSDKRRGTTFTVNLPKDKY